MSLRVNNNVAALNAYRNLSKADESNAKSLERLSSGKRINRAADDAAGLVISQKLTATVGGLNVATKNAQDGVGVVQTAEGALDETSNMLQRMRELAMNAANTGVADATSTQADQDEFDALSSEIDRIAGTTSFGGKKLLDGSEGGGTGKFDFAVGSDASVANTVSVTIAKADTTTLGVNGLALGAGNAAVAAIDTALDTVSAQRGMLGATQNRLEHAISNLGNQSENLTAANSRITDTDMAAEMTNFTKTQVISQAATSMLAQANQSAPAKAPSHSRHKAASTASALQLGTVTGNQRTGKGYTRDNQLGRPLIRPGHLLGNQRAHGR